MTSLKLLTLSLEEVKELLTSGEGTGVKRKEEAVTLQIPPMYGANIQMGVKRELDAMSSRYSTQLGGIPMAWEKIRIPSTGALIDTSPYIHTSVYGIFYIFSPKINDSLQGTIKNKSPSHLSCLVHRIFNVFVPRPDEISAQEWVGSTLEVGDVIKIGVTNIDMSLYLPRITGRLESVVARKVTPPVVGISESPMGKVFTDTKISSSEEEEEEEEEKEEEEGEEEEIGVPVAKETKLLPKKTKAASKKTRVLTKNEKKLKMRSPGGEKAKKKKEVKRGKKKLKAVSFFANRVGGSPTKKEKKNQALREAELDALFLSSLLAEDAAREITSSSSSQRVSKKRKEEEEEEEEEEVKVPVTKETKLLPKKTKVAAKKTRVLTMNEKQKLKMKNPGGEKAKKKKKEVKRAKEKLKDVVSLVANRVGDFPTKKEKKNLSLHEAELDALFLSSLLAEDAARGITSSSSQKVSKKRKAEDVGSKNKTKRILFF